MKVGLTGSGLLALAGIAVVGFVGYKLYTWFRANPGAFNPASSANLANKATHAAVSAAVGYDETLGGWVSDKVFALRHPGFTFSGPSQTRVKPISKPSTALSTPAYGLSAPYSRTEGVPLADQAALAGAPLP